MSRRLDDLTPEMRLKAFELIARCAERGIPIVIVDTLRTMAEQEAFIAKGVSWTKNSKHLPGADGKSRAIDVAPWLEFSLHGPDKIAWDEHSDISRHTWQTIGEIGEALGLRWGGRWKVRDLGHLELVEDAGDPTD